MSKQKQHQKQPPSEQGDDSGGSELYSVIPLTEVAPLPGLIVPLYVSKPSVLAGLSHAIETQAPVVLALQHGAVDEPTTKDNLAEVAGLAAVLQSVRHSNGHLQASLHVQHRVLIAELDEEAEFLRAAVTTPAIESNVTLREEDERRIELLKQNMRLLSDFDESLREHLDTLENMFDPGSLADLAGSVLPLKPLEGKRILDELDPLLRLALASEMVEAHLRSLRIRSRIAVRASDELEEAQREELLREQLRVIREELGEEDEEDEVQRIRERLPELALPEDVLGEIEKQLRRLSRMHPDSGEAALQRTYLDWILELPWSARTEDAISLAEVRNVLDREHYGLEQSKERILDFLGVKKLRGSIGGPLLLFVGPPGVGKTSLGRSIASAIGRSFVHVSLGGLRDEAELRGHRRTYVGAMPGRIMQGLRRAGSKNPVFVLDELDKIGSDFRGDPASVLLEILDREQNSRFEDHYINLPFDLSEVMFIGTANITDSIPAPLLDRMEVIEINGYTDQDKLQIARHFLCPRIQDEHGLKNYDIELSDKTIQHVISGYTRESGVRGLQKSLSSIYRRIARKVAEGGKPPADVTPKLVQKLLGPVQHVPDRRLLADEVGVVNGLAWTPVGGELMIIEVSRMKGKGELSITGQLGGVMQESAHAALTFVLSRSESLDIPQSLYENSRVHVHVPEGAIPKDGPSAGIAIAAALVSVLTGRPIRCTVAMTGEITLRGSVLAVGGLREKALAALRAGVQTILIPKGNERELVEFPDYLRSSLSFVPVETVEEVFAAALHPRVERRLPSGKAHLPSPKGRRVPPIIKD